MAAEIKRVTENWEGKETPTTEECEVQAMINLSSQEHEGKSYLDDEKQYWRTIDTLLERQGLTTLDVEGTGSCLFHCMSIQMFGDQRASRFLRVLSSLWLLDFKHIKAATLIASEGKVKDPIPAMLECMGTARAKQKVTSESWLEYCYKFAHDASFSADYVHVGALVAIFGLSLKVFTVVPENHQPVLGHQDLKCQSKVVSCLRRLNLTLRKHGPYRLRQVAEHPMQLAVSSRHYRIVAQKGATSELQFELDHGGHKSADSSLEPTIVGMLAAIDEVLKFPPSDMPMPIDDDGKFAPSEPAASEPATKEIVIDLEDETEVGEEEAQDNGEEENEEEEETQERVQGAKKKKQEEKEEEEYESNAGEDGREEEDVDEDDGEDIEECDDEGNVIVPGKKMMMASRRRQRSRSVARQRSRSIARPRQRSRSVARPRQRSRSASPKQSHSRSTSKKQKTGIVPKNPLERCYVTELKLLMEREYEAKQEVIDVVNQVAQ